MVNINGAAERRQTSEPLRRDEQAWRELAMDQSPPPPPPDYVLGLPAENLRRAAIWREKYVYWRMCVAERLTKGMPRE